MKKATNAQFRQIAATCHIAAVVLIANSSARPIDGPNRPEGVSADWKQINSNVPSDEFSFWAPPDVQEQKGMPGIDELILSWHGSQLVISVLCCGYHTSPVQPPNSSHQELSQKVSGRNASLFIYEDRKNHPKLPYVVDLYVPSAGGQMHFKPVRFSMTIRCKDQADIDTARRIVASLKFNRMGLSR
ncbi:MAG TPA: hypothetical protein VMT20_27100 [Terriglobia bacterium]|nr:hypothetical protein [Terriglobia bacterium]